VVNPTNTTIKRDGVQLAPPYDVIQKSGQKSVYSFESPAYDSTTQEIVLSSNESKSVPVTLLPNIVSARFVTDPPGGRIFDENGGLIPDSGVHLRWGSHVLSAKYEGLEPITTNMWISVDDKANAMLALQFRYGTLIFTSSPPGALIFKEEQVLGATPTNLYLLPAPESAYRMVFENQTNQTKTLRASVEQGSIKYLGAVFTNANVLEVPLAGSSEYLELVKFNNYWVGKYDVTQSQYQRITGSNPSYFNQTLLKADWDPSLPVENLVRDDALKFCALLNTQEADWLSNNRLKGFAFTLPTQDEWVSFLGDGKEKRLIYYSSMNQKKVRTGRVGLMGANTNGLYDVDGNVRQWLLNGDLAGCCFSSVTTWPYGVGVEPGGNMATDEAGFRVILKAAVP
jgi:hypothetical protein